MPSNDLCEDHVRALDSHVWVWMIDPQASGPDLSTLDNIIKDLVLALLVLAEFNLDIGWLLHIIRSSQLLIWQEFGAIHIDDGWFTLSIVHRVENDGYLIE